MQFQYGAPTPSTARPKCWSASFDEGTRECRGCGFQVSCKEETLRVRANRQVTPVQQQYSPQYQPYAVPQPVTYPAPQVVPQFRGLPLAQIPPQQVPQQVRPQTVQQIHPPPPQQYGYGWIQDPMYYTLTSAPPPMRPQIETETFLNRVLKNAALAILEAFFGQCLLAIRQMVLPPKK